MYMHERIYESQKSYIDFILFQFFACKIIQLSFIKIFSNFNCEFFSRVKRGEEKEL